MPSEEIAVWRVPKSDLKPDIAKWHETSKKVDILDLPELHRDAYSFVPPEAHSLRNFGIERVSEVFKDWETGTNAVLKSRDIARATHAFFTKNGDLLLVKASQAQIRKLIEDAIEKKPALSRDQLRDRIRKWNPTQTVK
ncbi:MAG: hypothetical protein ABIG96_06035 [Candidatus Micrarchaeota archaeon]